MQGVTELVEHRAGLVQGEQRRLAGVGLGDVEVVGDDGVFAEEAALVDVFVHPRAAAFGGAGVEVAEEDGEGLAVGVEHVPDAHVGLIDGEVLSFLEGDAVELRRGEEDAVGEDVVDLEIRAELGFVEGEPGLADLLGVEGPVGGGEGMAGVLVAVNERLHLGGFLARVGDGGGGEVGEEFVDGREVAGGLFLQLVSGVVRVTEEVGALGAEAGDLGDDAAVVVGAAVGVAARGRRP